MKKIIYILAISVLLGACSAQQRLNRLLTAHPELHYVDTITKTIQVVVHDTLIITPDTNSINLTSNDIASMDSMANNGIVNEVQVNSSHSGASLQALGNGQFQLNTFTKPDTVIIHDTINKPVPVPVPTYITKTEIKEVEVYKMTWYQEALCWIGGLVLIIGAIIFAIKLTTKL